MSLPTRINVPIPKDERGYIGRECPIASCEGYFKIKLGTGLKGKDLPCHCAYCGHTASHDQFATKEQVEFVRSVAHRKVVEELYDEFKKFELDIKPRGPFGIGISMKMKRGEPIPLRQYRERTLETHICCNECALEYSVYGVFAFCPDCGNHNSYQTLQKNIDLVRKQLTLAENQTDDDFKRHLIEDALENCVSVFDGFARESCRVRAHRGNDSTQRSTLSFQNLPRSAKRVRELFNVEMTKGISPTDWNAVHVAFMRRHVLAHRGGVIDQQYLDETKESASLLGRRMLVTVPEVERVAKIVLVIGRSLLDQLPSHVNKIE
jgi:hypothetical protein